MKYHIALKFLAVLLCTCFLVTALASAAAVIGIASAGLYSRTVEDLRAEEMEWRLQRLAESLAEQYAAEKLGGLTDSQVDIFCPLIEPELLTGQWCYTIEDYNGNVLRSNLAAEQTTQEFSFWIDSTYPVVLEDTVTGQRGQESEKVTTPATDPEKATAPTAAAEYFYTQQGEYYNEAGVTHSYRLGICHGPIYRVTILLTEGAYGTEQNRAWQLAELGYQYRYTVIGVLFASVLLFALMLTYLCCAAGRSRSSDTVRPGGLNRIPLDLYAFAVGMAGILAIWIGGEVTDCISDEAGIIPAVIGVTGLAAAACLLLVGFLFAFAAQVKTKNGFWWRHSVIGWVLRWVFSALKWVFHGLGRLVHYLPLTWQWLLTAAGMCAMLLIAVLFRSASALLFAIVACIAIVIYGACCFGKLFEGARRMSHGDLNSKVNSGMMVGSFREFAMDLNALADVAVEAAKRQMTSERMRAELITNVSHDIKTPLTSIINYVDLLQKAETEEEKQQYLEVLARQSQRMKKLIEDLMDMSKASSGAMNCELTRVDAAEAVNQALGEFADKLEQAGLKSVVRYPEEPTAMMADGRLTWRVLSNLLSNAVKYAMPGTRLYVDVVRLDGKVLISLKNISREPLNTSAGELMERFVRGDASRNTEGSDLGLNIAKSLMELQHGQLQLLVDGDLFKATMILPEA